MRKLKKVLLACMMGVVAFALTGCGSTTIDLNKYVTIEAEGYDSMGTLNYTFDYEAFEKDYDGKIKANVKSSDGGTAAEIALELAFGAEVTDVFVDYCVNYQLDKRSELSNGDVVNLTWNCEDEDAKKFFNVKLKYSDIQYTVKGLDEVGTFNPFDYVNVSFSGISPYGSVTITPDYDRTEMQYVNFTVDKNNGLKNGETVVVSASISGNAASFVERYGCTLGKTEETYTVEGLSGYIADIEDVPTELFNKMDKQLNDSFNAYKANNLIPEASASLKLVGNYLCTLKDGMTESPNNFMYYVYQVSYSDSVLSDYTYYWYGYFEDIILLADGTCTVDLSSYTVSESYRFFGECSGDYLALYTPEDAYGELYVAGFADLESLFNQQIVTKIENYEYEQKMQ